LFCCSSTDPPYYVIVNTTYGAISTTVQRYADAVKNLKVHKIVLNFPTQPGAIVSLFRRHIEGLQRKPGATVMAIIDGIISVPGASIPWEELVKICRDNGVYSLIDGAHLVGQIPVDVQRADPDFLVSVRLV
jgi:hercynylcysteine S-oxide lyase